MPVYDRIKSTDLVNGRGAHPASNGFFPQGIERPSRESDPSPPISALRKRESIYIYIYIYTCIIIKDVCINIKLSLVSL
jgi:hypothetical protein